VSQGPAPKSRADAESDAPASAPSPQAESGGYTVVARRYRPQSFEDVVGQDHVVQALRNAIRLNRLAQAYLFCGTRGVGKTSMARIFAKCLNCVHGPTETPCQVCDICRAIAEGQDVDVIEIDGASNNGVEQVRELRQNVSLRPSRARFKIYYIDEVHMLSTGAFNALLKTLEEPPPHVKFLFATTEVNKIPITVLSRCQRFDFAGITPEAIVDTLQSICEREGVEAEPEALRIVARRAGGSMRDAQSLLEQLLSAGGAKLTVESVHARLGTASDERLLDLLEALARRDPAAALTLLDQAAGEGVQPSDLLAGALDFLRDAMALAVGAETTLLTVSPRETPRLKKIVENWPLDSVVAALQILAEARARMRGVAHGRLLAELALVRVARLENLTDFSEMMERLRALEAGNAPPASSVKKRLSRADSVASHETVIGKPANLAAPAVEPAESRPAPPPTPTPEPTPSGDHPPLDLQTIHDLWPTLVKKVGTDLGWRLSQAAPIGLDGPDVLVIGAKPGYNSVADYCATEDARRNIARSLQTLLHRPVTIRYEHSGDSPDAPPPVEARRADKLADDPMVQKIVELFEARMLHLDYEGDREDDRPR